MSSDQSKSTNRHSLHTLAKVLAGRLESKKYIEFSPKTRETLYADLASYLNKYILTEEDLTNQVREHVSRVSGSLAEQSINETEAFQSQKKALRAKYADNAVHGLYLKVTLRELCTKVLGFLFDYSGIDEVFGTDDVITQLVMTTIQTFDESKLS